MYSIELVHNVHHLVCLHFNIISYFIIDGDSQSQGRTINVVWEKTIIAIYIFEVKLL